MTTLLNVCINFMSVSEVFIFPNTEFNHKNWALWYTYISICMVPCWNYIILENANQAVGQLYSTVIPPR